MIEFDTIDGRRWLTHDAQFNLALESLPAWPSGVRILREEDVWNVYNRAIVSWRDVGNPFDAE